VSEKAAAHAGRLAGPFTLIGAVLLATAAAAHLRFPIGAVHGEFVIISGFLVLLTTLAACGGVRLVEVRCDWLQLVALVTTAAGVFIASQAGIIGSADTPFELLGIIAYAAWMEELVFRRLLPRAFERTLHPAGRGTGAVCIVASQVLFAVSHFTPGLQYQSHLGVMALIRLFAGGLLLAAVVSRSGLAIGALLHAELNLRAVLPQPPPQTASTLGVCLIALLALGLTLFPLMSPFFPILTSRRIT
jgi:hypothetical protein